MGMNSQREDGQLSPSGVWVATDFRSNLIIDRYDPVFADMRASKLKHLRSVNSEDAVTWNVFRSLRQVAPTTRLPLLWERAFRGVPIPPGLQATVTLRRSELLGTHRSDGLVNLAALGSLRWADLGEVLLSASTGAPREDERGYASRAHAWLSQRGLIDAT